MRNQSLAIIFSLVFFLDCQLSFAQNSERGLKPANEFKGFQNIQRNQFHALLIGISNYTKEWPDLPGVIEDIPRIERVLRNYGFTVDKVIDPNKIELEDAFSTFINKYGKNTSNRLLIYYAGHGHNLKDINGIEKGYLVPVDAPDPNLKRVDFLSLAFSMNRITEDARKIGAQHVLYIFDACFSGAITRSGIPSNISYAMLKPVRQFITSGNSHETVLDRSIFCDELITGLEGSADIDKDKYITGSELGMYIQKQVINKTNNFQHPQFWKSIDQYFSEGDFVFRLSDYTPPNGSSQMPDEKTYSNNTSMDETVVNIDNYLRNNSNGIYFQKPKGSYSLIGKINGIDRALVRDRDYIVISTNDGMIWIKVITSEELTNLKIKRHDH